MTACRYYLDELSRLDTVSGSLQKPEYANPRGQVSYRTQCFGWKVKCAQSMFLLKVGLSFRSTGRSWSFVLAALTSPLFLSCIHQSYLMAFRFLYRYPFPVTRVSCQSLRIARSESVVFCEPGHDVFHPPSVLLGPGLRHWIDWKVLRVEHAPRGGVVETAVPFDKPVLKLLEIVFGQRTGAIGEHALGNMVASRGRHGSTSKRLVSYTGNRMCMREYAGKVGARFEPVRSIAQNMSRSGRAGSPRCWNGWQRCRFVSV